MSLYKEVLKSIKDNKEKRLRGDIIAIPWTGLPRLSKVLPGVMKENYTIVTAHSKIGKTQIGDYLYLYQPIDYLFNNPHINIDVDIQYFSLELSKDAKMRQAISYRLFSKYGIEISPQDLRSTFNDYILEDEVEHLIEQEQEWFEFFQSKVTFYDSIRNPYGILYTVKNKLEENGHLEYKMMEFSTNGVKTMSKVRDKYIPNNPDLITIVITDHVGLLQPEKNEFNDTPYSALGRFSSRHCLELRDIYKCQVVNIQQQAPASEEQQYTIIGGTILDKVKPTPDGLGTNKSTHQDCNLMISLFHPTRYHQKTYGNIDLTRMKDSHRELFININRDGRNNVGLDLYFNGACNYFEELPLHKGDLEKFYNKIELIKERKSNI